VICHSLEEAGLNDMDSNKMRAIVIARPGGPEVLEIRDVSRPEPHGADVLVRVWASALNRADVLQRRGRYPAPPGSPAAIPGLEFAGEVTDVGPAVGLWKRGQRVIGLVGGGAQAEYLLAHERTLSEIPGNLSWAEAAAIPEAFITAHDALWLQAALRPNERVLIHAVASGVGLAAVQLTHAMNAVACGTTRTCEKLERAKTLGLSEGFVVSGVPNRDSAKLWSVQGQFDVILDLVGGEYTNASLHALAPRGRILLIGSMAGSKAELDLGVIMGKRAKMIGTMLRARPIEEKITANLAFRNEVLPLFARGVLKPVIDSEFDWSEIQKAHEHMESDKTLGKIVLRIS